MKLFGTGGYEHLREEGVRLYCAGWIGDGLPIQGVIQRVQRFARYPHEKDAERIIREMQAQNTNSPSQIT